MNSAWAGGVFQAVGDGLKLIFKEMLTPKSKKMVKTTTPGASRLEMLDENISLKPIDITRFINIRFFSFLTDLFDIKVIYALTIN